MNGLSDGYVLKNGVKIPCVGYGTWKLKQGKTSKELIKTAIAEGYRHIDTAMIYLNEHTVGRAVRESGIARSEIFITSKLWNVSQGYKSTLKAFRATMRRLRLDYLDLYLIHWPLDKDNWKEYAEGTWRAFEELYDKGLIKAIGVSNFRIEHLEFLLSIAKVPPMVNQIELHPGKPQDELIAYCKEKGILVEAWGPLGRGRLTDDPIVAGIAAKHGKTPAQVLIRWSIDRGAIPLPKTATAARIKENADVFDFTLDEEDFKSLQGIEKFDVLKKNKD